MDLDQISGPACYGRDNRDGVPLFERGFQVLQESNVIAVDIDIHKAADLSRFITDSLFDSWKLPVQVFHQGADIAALAIHFIGPVGEFAKGRWHTNTHRHSQPP